MTDNEIIKALPKIWYGGHGCKKCKYHMMGGDERCGLKGCYIARQALDLINRQQAEIERLNGENKAFGEIIKKQDDEISVLRKDLLKREDLEKSFSKTVKQFDKKFAKTVKLERAEAVKEFAERLKEETTERYEDIAYKDLFFGVIDNLLKEMG